MVATLRFDGASRGNPGPASYGFVLAWDDIVVEGSDFIGTATNNEAEYAALQAGLEAALDHDIETVDIVGDSELIVRQILGEYSVNAENLQPMHWSVMDMLESFEKWSIEHVRRGRNERADDLANQALDDR